jgi:hypothetical protein
MGCEVALVLCTPFPKTHRSARFYGGRAAERLNAVLQYLNLMACTSLPDYAENDINTVTNISRILLQDVRDVRDVFGEIEQRGFEVPKKQ